MRPASLTTEPIILASASASRRRMLEAAGVEVHAEAARVDEEEIKLSGKAAGMKPPEVAEALADLKASKLARKYVGAYVVGGDQMLECDGRWFDKPVDRADAASHLRLLSGRTHTLYSAVVVFHNGTRVWHHIDHATLTMRALSDAFIDRYLDAAGDAVLSCAGSYQVEGLGAQLFNKVKGDHFTIQGLPLLPLLDFLRVRKLLPA
ncbi:septum formation protein Maf [alpha proteobacterium AAP38]|nr:septum formation protein Maf [alpha proteobacterium AAP38]